MDKGKKEQAEKLQIKLDKLLLAKEKKQQAFEKSKQELNAVTKDVDTMKLKLFEILQSGSDDTTFSNWAKRKINETSTTGKAEKPATPNPQPNKGQNQNQPQQQNPNQRQ